MPNRTLLHRKCSCGGNAGPTGECQACRKKRLDTRHLKPKPENRNELLAPPTVAEALRSPGQPLDQATRALMESRLGYNFGNVRVHLDRPAADSAQAVNALAYTVGRDIVFAERQYAPGTREGRRLLAHELTHVAQQRFDSDKASASLGSLAHEEEANETADRLVAGKPIRPPSTRTGIMVAKQEAESATYPLAPTYNFAQAVQEIESPTTGAPETGILFNGFDVFVRIRGKTVIQSRAFSGQPGIEEKEKDLGPIPDGLYYISPQRRIASIKSDEFQTGGIMGARGFDVGLQEIYNPSVQSTWGKTRIAIEGTKQPGKEPRSGFFLHGGTGRTTHGCIKVSDDGVFEVLKTKIGARVPLVVRKTVKLEKQTKT